MKSRHNRSGRSFGVAIAAVAAMVSLSGCMRDMQDDSRYKPFEATDFFKDGTTARGLVRGTVPVGGMKPEASIATGQNADGGFVQKMPVAVTRQLLERGRERFDIYCSLCHGLTGDGKGPVVLRGFSKLPPSYHEERLRNAVPGYFVFVATNGFGLMPSMADQVSVEDRWAIAAYIKALQYSRQVPKSEVPAKVLAGLEKSGGSVDENGDVPSGRSEVKGHGHAAAH